MTSDIDKLKEELVAKYPWLESEGTIKIRARDFWKVMDKAYRLGIKTEHDRPKGFDETLRDLMQ